MRRRISTYPAIVWTLSSDSQKIGPCMSRVLGVKIIGHDTGAAIVTSRTVIAIAEERLSRVNHSFHAFPRIAIDYCLEATNLGSSRKVGLLEVV